MGPRAAPEGADAEPEPLDALDALVGVEPYLDVAVVHCFLRAPITLNLEPWA